MQGAALEKIAASLTDTELTPGSGCGLRFKGDLQHEDWLLEVKSTRAKRITFDTNWVIKAEKQGHSKGKDFWAVIFGWTERPEGYKGSLYFVATKELPDKPVDKIFFNSKTRTFSHSVLERITEDMSVAVLTNNTTPFVITTLDNFKTECLK